MILASQSPRRRELLQRLGMPFRVEVAHVDETMDMTKPVEAEVARVSLRKARAILCSPEEIVVAADTVVVCDGQVMGKPKDKEDAFRMLSTLSGRTHQVMTGMTVKRGKQELVHTEITDITFRELTPEEIWAYIATGEPMDKAGSYGIQSGGAVFAQHICGDYYNIVGLPVCRLYQMLKALTEENG